jgi:hypothetical protein
MIPLKPIDYFLTFVVSLALGGLAYGLVAVATWSLPTLIPTALVYIALAGTLSAILAWRLW